MTYYDWCDHAPIFSAAVVLVLLAAVVPGGRADDAAAMVTYEEDVAFLRQHTRVTELTDDRGARVVICPEYQGRVMTSTAGGPAGRSFGWINRDYIQAGRLDRHFANYGGEDRFWLGPEGGQFALWFAPGAEQVLANWLTPRALNEGGFRVQAVDRTSCRMKRQMELYNAARTDFDLEVTRTVRLLSTADFAQLFGSGAQSALDQQCRLVGFETDNVITNRGDDVDRAKGLVSIWILGMFRPGPRTVIIVPYIRGDEAELGPVVESGYFGTVPPERLVVTPVAILFLGDGNFRAKIGVSPRRARPICGSIDFDAGVLTLVHFSLPNDAASQLYVNNLWDLPQENPYAGDAMNSYNDGPPEPGAESLGGFYELETLSPARPLKRGESLAHQHRTYHVEGGLEALSRVAQAALGVDLDEVRQAMFP